MAFVNRTFYWNPVPILLRSILDEVRLADRRSPVTGMMTLSMRLSVDLRG